MNLSTYTNFFNIQLKENTNSFVKLNYDFNVYFGTFLNKINCNPYFIRSICNTVFASMTSDKCYYHNPVHVMNILAHAEKLQIKLEDYEVLAILFHDAIYRPMSKTNEVDSINFMFSVLKNTGISESVKHQAATIIQMTSMHLEDDLDPIANTVLDLDMIAFSVEADQFKLVNDLIKMELVNDLERYDGISSDDYTNGRKEFLTKLLNKKSIYRTMFMQSKFETIARNNIKTLI